MLIIRSSMKIKKYIKRFVPSSIWSTMHLMRYKHSKQVEIEAYQHHYISIEQRLRQKKRPFTVLFLALDATCWKLDSVYLEMQKSSLFNPIILVCPQVNRGYDFMMEKLQSCAKFFEDKGYEYILTYNELSDTYFDAHSLKPDIIFYTNPYKGLINDQYYIDNFPDSLLCYVNYGYINVHFEWGFNLPFHQKIWRYFVECDENLKLIKKYSPNNANNCLVTGFPMYDAFIEGTSIGKDWKIQDSKRKRIIWSPHHSISIQSQMIKLSTFELYFDSMLKIARKFKDQIQIVFKPHPLLKEALYRLDGWGKERTDKYYEQWENGENTSTAEGEYVDLFNSSDAMINDSASFTIEYLYTSKPCLYLNNYDRQVDANEVALKAFDCWYKATTEEQIENFIIDVVLNGNDPLKNKREKFYNDVLVPPHGLTASENILNEIKRELHIR